MRINPRTYDIFTALNESSYPNGPFVMPDILKGCVTACDEWMVRQVMNRINKSGESALPYARFFSILYTDADVRRFIEAFDEAAPDDYVQEADLDTSMPWCMPWTWESAPLSAAEEEDTPESLARRYVAENYKAIQQTFRDWKEDDRARIVQDIWDSYRNGKEIPDKYEHQAGLFRKAFDAIDEMGENTVETDGTINQIAEEISNSFIKEIF